MRPRTADPLRKGGAVAGPTRAAASSLRQPSLRVASLAMRLPIVFLSAFVLVKAQFYIRNEDGLRNVRKRVTNMLRERLGRRPKEVCYEVLGCFPMDRPLKKGPQDPRHVDTRFFLFTRDTESEEISYADNRDSLLASHFDPRKPTRMLVHGFKGSSKDVSAKYTIKRFLEQEDCNVIMLDWEKGAQGPSYRHSAANTQLVGRQLELMLLYLISLGALPNSIHVVGFSLGAHIAGFAGRSLSQRGIRLGRITGLDPASPLFREYNSGSLPALSKNDAALVDVVHTDGAILLTEGFGLLKPLGHADYFPNGGQNQPGCDYVFASVLVSHLEGTVNGSTVCNHVRGIQLFIESISPEESCQFRSFPCHSREHFHSGACFPSTCQANSTDGTCGLMGYRADSGLARGPMYLVTRDHPPFCGDQLQGIVVLTKNGQRPRNHISLIIKTGNETEDVTALNLHADLREGGPGYIFRGLGAGKYGSFNESLKSVNVSVVLRPSARKIGEPVYLDFIRINSLDGDHWAYCGKQMEFDQKEDYETVTLELVHKGC